MDIDPALIRLTLHILEGELLKIYPAYQKNVFYPQYSSNENTNEKIQKLRKAISLIEEL
jgi:hypothetical protein